MNFNAVNEHIATLHAHACINWTVMFSSRQKLKDKAPGPPNPS